MAAAAAAAVTVGGALALDDSSSSPTAVPTTPSVVQPSSRPMTQGHRDPMIASVALTPVAWGTKLELTCSYPPGALRYEGGAYALVVHTKDGRSRTGRHLERTAR